MNLEQQTGEQLDRLTAEVIGGPDLDRVIRDGRRARRRRTARLGIVAVGATGLAVAAAWQVIPASTPEVAVDDPPAAAGPTYHDFVTGTQVDEQIQATAATHLPGLTDATDVFPSDWSHSAMNPPVEYQNATEWQAYYEPSVDDHLVVFTGKKVPGHPAGYGCDEAAGPGSHGCTFATLPDGATLIQYASLIGDSGYSHWYASYLVRADGSVASIVEHVRADTWAQADERRVFTYAQGKALVLDPQLEFPDPVDPPAPPSW